MSKPSYCTQNHGDCDSCSLVNYGRECQNNPVDVVKKYLSSLGQKGGTAGRGEKKKRGDSDYYKKIRAVREAKRVDKQE